MELELEQDVIVCYEVVGQVSTCQEETQEAIVPDACPDILRLADVCAQAFVSRWEVREGQAVVIGYIQASVLYIPESGHAIRKMEVKLPFSVHMEMNAIASSIIGGTMLTGGVGNIIGTLFGVLSLSTIKNIVSSAGLGDAWWTNITIALMLCLFLVIQSVVMARKKRGLKKS